MTNNLKELIYKHNLSPILSMSASEIHNYKQALLISIDKINKELEKRVTPINSQTWLELEQWRKRANAAKTAKTYQVKVIDRYMEVAGFEDYNLLIKRTIQIIQNLEQDGVEFYDDEREVLKKLEQIVK
jgi:hypothetical protein